MPDQVPDPINSTTLRDFATKEERKKGSERSRLTSQVLTLLILSICVISWGCSPEVGATCADDGSGTFVDKLNIIEPQFRNAFANQTDVAQAHGFWFTVSDLENPANGIEYGWNGTNLQFREGDAADNCSFEDDPGDGCYQCDLCVEGLAECNNNTEQGITDASLELLTLTAIDKKTSKELVYRRIHDPGTGCFLRPNLPAPLSFRPTWDATFSVKKHHPCGTAPEEIARYETAIVSTPRPFVVTPEPYHDAADPTVRRYIYEMPVTNGKLDLNFSSNLKVTTIRVLKGTVDPATGMDGTPSTNLDDLEKMRPSRILFLPSFVPGDVNNSPDEETNRCYVNPATADGDFDLWPGCRNGVNPPNYRSHDVTPTYMNAPGRRGNTLTWIIEYKESDGLPGPPDFGGGFPVLEFTIEVR